MFGHVCRLELLERFGRGRLDRGVHAGVGIAAHVRGADEVGRRREEQRDRVGAAHHESVVVGGHLPAARNRLQPRDEPKPPGNPEVVCGLAADDQTVAAERVHPEVVRRVVRMRLVAVAPKLRGEGQAPCRFDGQSHYDHLVNRRREDFAGEAGATAFVRGARDRGVEIELVPVVGNAVGAVERQDEISDRLVLLLLDRIPHQASSEQPVGAHELPVEKQPSDLGQRRGATRNRCGVRAARPVSVFVDLNQFFVGTGRTPSRRGARCRPAARSPTSQPGACTRARWRDRSKHSPPGPHAPGRSGTQDRARDDRRPRRHP